ncbi:hypothetical protein JDV02_010416 [Purpureocillium takamizusanense]|uniref:Uncharacterized protein n=1 Tax=Purpureocillium takamizusanense TaxID=2060973 RepID=A0A9Q8QSX0_9HYPO|nr:uncharacterized protein JDV02_010416 [Purpureocillium takamizusanense]UNI24686.1 hypothetical protein JDV02_010416 [Purpureocillium takamizusanense]
MTGLSCKNADDDKGVARMASGTTRASARAARSRMRTEGGARRQPLGRAGPLASRAPNSVRTPIVIHLSEDAVHRGGCHGGGGDGGGGVCDETEGDVAVHSGSVVLMMVVVLVVVVVMKKMTMVCSK